MHLMLKENTDHCTNKRTQRKESNTSKITQETTSTHGEQESELLKTSSGKLIIGQNK